MDRLSLRLRVFLFFALLGLGGAVAVLGALYAGYGRALATTPANGFALAAILSTLAIVGLSAGIWLLFDENLAKPIERLAADLRVRAHAGVGAAVDTSAARYLGDLAPAAQAVSTALSTTAMDSAQRVAAETRRLEAEKARLTALLTEIPVAMMLVNAQDQIVLYDGQAAEVLAQLGVPRLNAALSDYFDPAALTAAVARMHRSGREEAVQVKGRHGRTVFDARLRPMDGGGYILLIDEESLTIAPEAARPIVFDFDLMERQVSGAVEDTPLTDLTYAVFDTETTGLLPHKDEIVQIGAVRVVNGRIVPGEVFDQLVDPGRPIPPASTAVHNVSDAMVAGQPKIDVVARRFHDFARGSVIVAHNAPFDMAFLHRHAGRCGVTWDHPVLDTVLLSAVLFGASQKHTLDALCDRLSVTIPAALRHTALGDARATAEVLVRMLPMLRGRGLETFGDVLAQTRQHGRLLQDLN